MTAEGSPKRSFSPATVLAFALLAAGLLGSVPWLVHPWYDPTNDGAMYLLTGRALAAGDGYSMLGQPFRIRPPAFSLMIAPLLGGAGVVPFRAVNVLVTLWGVGACLLFFLWARERHGRALAWLLAAALWLNPGFRELCNQPMSDVPGLALLLACLCLERWADRAPSWRRDAALGLAIGLGAWLRSQVVLLAPAIVAVRLLARALRRTPGEPGAPDPWTAWRGRSAALLAVVVLVQAPWHLRNGAVDAEPPADQTRLWSYGTAMWHEDMGDPGSRQLELREVLERVPLRGGQLLGVLADRMRGGGPGPGWVATALLGSVLWVALKRRESPELFALGSCALVAVYFGFAPRLVLPLYLIALPAAVETLRDVVRWLLARAGSARAERAAWLVAVLALLGVVAVDFDPRPRWREIELEHRRLEAITQRFAARVAPDAVLASNRPWHYAVLMDRPVYALEFVVRRTGRPEDLEALIDRYGIDTVILSPAEPKDCEVLPYFEERYGPQTDPLARVFRVR